MILFRQWLDNTWYSTIKRFSVVLNCVDSLNATILENILILKWSFLFQLSISYNFDMNSNISDYLNIFICLFSFVNLDGILQNQACLKQNTSTWTRRWHYTADAVKRFCQNISTAKGVRSLNCNPRLTIFNSFLMWFYKPHQNNNYPGNEIHVQKWLIYIIS